MAVKRFEELQVYQRAFEAAMRIFELSKRWPKEELYSLTESDYIDLNKTYDRISGGLVMMMTNPGKWCGPASLVREDGADYNIDP